MRVWYPQFDVYDGVRRMLLLLGRTQEHEFSLERLFIADFYVCNPALLHKIKASSQGRKEINQLNVPKPEKSFLSYPAPALLFHRMSAVQKEAVSTLIGKSALDAEALAQDRAVLTDAGRALADEVRSVGGLNGEDKIVEFVSRSFGPGEVKNISALRRNVHLRRMTI